MTWNICILIRTVYHLIIASWGRFYASDKQLIGISIEWSISTILAAQLYWVWINRLWSFLSYHTGSVNKKNMVNQGSSMCIRVLEYSVDLTTTSARNNPKLYIYEFEENDNQ